jgi:hypothetical protein
MKKAMLTFAFCLFFAGLASAQFIPSFQFGMKGGADFSTFPAYNDYHNKGQVGYIGGFWARIGALGFNFQPELYVTGTNVNVADNAGNVNRAKFTSVDVPLLFGTKIGGVDFGGRFYTGPLISYAIIKNQGFGQTSNQAVRLDYRDENYAWQIGAGIDIKSLSIDLRYEAGINKVGYGPTDSSNTRLNLFSLSLSYSLYSEL